MHQFFSASLEKSRLVLVEGQIHFLRMRIGSLSQRSLQASNQVDNLTNQLTEFQNKYEALEDQYRHKQETCEQKQQELRESEREGERLEEERQEAEQKHQATEETKKEKEQQCNHLKHEKSRIKENIEELEYAIQKLDAIILSPAPQAQYKIDGLYCENGIYNCKNHPPRQVLANQEEIQHHNAKVDKAKTDKSELLNELASLERHYREVKHQCDEADMELLVAQTECLQWEDRVSEQSRKIDENKALQEQIRREHDRLVRDLIDLQHQMQEMQREVDALSQELVFAQQQALEANNEQKEAELELQRLLESVDQIRAAIRERQELKHQIDLEALAKRELVEEETRIYTLQDLEELARREVEAEQGMRSQREIASAEAEADTNVKAPTTFNKIESTYDQIKDTIGHAKTTMKETVSDVITTVSDIWPNVGIMTTRAMFETPEMRDLRRELGDNTADEESKNLLLRHGSK